MKKRIYIAAAFSIILSAIFFYRTFTRGLLPVPTDALVGLYHPWRDAFFTTYPRGVPYKNFLITDPIRQQIPWRKTVVDAWKSRTAPAWDPYVFMGAPLSANVQAAPFYPLNILFLFLPFPAAWTALVILQPILAAFFCMLYLLRLKRSFAASVVGSLAFAFGGFSVAWLTWGTILETALWLPLMLLAIDGIAAKRRPFLWAGILAFAIVMAVTAGHIQIALYACVAATAYAIWRWRTTPGFPVTFTVAAFIAGVLMSAVQWIPLLLHVPETVRMAAQSNWTTPGWFLPWKHLAQFAAPDYFGNPATLNYTGVWNYGELVGYVGILPLVFAISALGMSGVPAFFTAVLAATMLFMLPNPVSAAPFAWKLPFISSLQPTRLMMIADFSLAVLAAYGADMVQKKRTAFALGAVVVMLAALWAAAAAAGKQTVALHNLIVPTLLLSLGAVLVMLRRFFRDRKTARVLLWVLCAVVAMDLFRFGWKFTPFTPAAYWFPGTDVLSALMKSPRPFRVMSLDDRILPPNSAEYYGIESLEGYDPAVSARYDRFLSAFESGTAVGSQTSGFNRIYTAHNVDSRLLPYTNVRYVLSLSDVTRPFLRKTMSVGEVRVYENLAMLPRIYLADRVIQANGDIGALRALLDAAPEAVGVVEQPVSVMNIPMAPEEGVRIVRYGSQKIIARVTAVNTRLLVFLTSFDAGWHAEMDGQETPVMRANYLFMGVAVTPGTHDIVFTYR